MRGFMSDKEEAERLLAVMSGIEALDYRTRVILTILLIILATNIAFFVWLLASWPIG